MPLNEINRGLSFKMRLRKGASLRTNGIPTPGHSISMKHRRCGAYRREKHEKSTGTIVKIKPSDD